MSTSTSSPKRHRLKPLGLILLPLLLAAAWILLGQPGFSGVLAQARAGDNTECVVTQQCNGSMGEPYTVSFYSRSPGGIWNWQYIDHEADHWSTCCMEINAAKNQVKIYNGDKLERVLLLHPDDRWPEQRPPYLPAAPAVLQLTQAAQ